MKTAEERARELAEKWVLEPTIALSHLIEMALKEQDKITRHACAEAAAKNQGTVSMFATTKECAAYNRACRNIVNLCMNVKAV